MSPTLGEFLGTMLLVLLGNGVVANVVLSQTKGNNAGWITITFGWGMAVFVAVWCVGESSGAHINPAVTLGLAAAGKFPPDQIAGYLVAQMLGAMLGAILVYLVYRDHFAVTDDADAKLATFATGPAIRNLPSNLVSEVAGTFVLIFAILVATDPALLGSETLLGVEGAADMEIGLGSLGALPVGLLVFSIGLSLGGTTGYAINPARDLGPRIVHAILPIPNKRDNDWPYAWVPVVGPLLGALLAATVYAMVS